MPFRRRFPLWNIEDMWGEEFFPRIGGALGLASDIFEDNGNVIVNVALPGVDPDEINISVEGKLLKISGEKREEEEVKEKDYYRKEIRSGEFERILTLPVDVDTSKTEAEYKAGILSIKLPKKEPSKISKVKISVKK